MAAQDELTEFVRAALAHGVPRSQIEDVLRTAGWPPEETRRALAGFADLAFPVPVPRPRPYLSAREAFLYLLLFTTLYISALSLGQIAFAFINHRWPNPGPGLDTGRVFRESVRWAVSSLVVAFPIYALLSISLQRAMARDPAKRGSRIRKWLTYLTLFIGAGILIGDVIALIYGLLSGDLTTPFLLKCVTVGAIAGAAFGYYLSDLRRDEGEGAA